MFDLSYWQKQFFPSSDRCLHICWSELITRDITDIFDTARGITAIEYYSNNKDQGAGVFGNLREGQYPFLFVETYRTVSRDVRPENTEFYLVSELKDSRFDVRGGCLPPELAGRMLHNIFAANRKRKSSVRHYDRGVISFEMELREDEHLSYLCLARDPMPDFWIKTDRAENLQFVA